jgi:ferritin-like metal-binding protein YciE
MNDVQHSLATYVSDMLALEQHVAVPFRTQRDDADFRSVAAAATIAVRLASLAEAHIQTLQSALDSLGGHPAHTAKAALSTIEGWFAGAIDRIRKTKVAKGLRDDYTVLALCTASYSMLLTTANAFGNFAIAQLAKRHIQDYAQAIVDIGDALPLVVVDDLNQTGMPVDRRIVERSQAEIRSAWRTGESLTETGTIESQATLNRSKNPTYPTI